jgi:RND family efflux transporter MFP subunit
VYSQLDESIQRLSAPLPEVESPVPSASSKRLAVVIAGLLCLAVSGCAKRTTTAKAAEPAQVVIATPVKMPIVEWDEYVGRLEAIETVEVRSRVSGYLASSHFEEGQMVKEGDLLAVIDQRPYLAEISRNDADLSSAEAQLGQAKASATQSEAEYKRSQIRLDLAQKRLARTDELRKRNATTSDEFDLREAEFAEAQSEQTVAQARIDSSKSAVVAAEAAVGIAKAALEIARLNLQYTEIRSPISGRISRRYVTEGNLVSGGSADSTLLTTIVSVDPIHCYFDADEQSFLKYMKLASEGIRPSSRDVRNPVYLALSNEKEGFPHWGHMDFVENRLDEETATIRGRAILANQDLLLTPGLFARVRIPGSARYEAILVPDRAIGTDQNEKYVLVVDDQKKVGRRLVTLGPISHGLRIIRSGLTGNERVVLSGQQKARAGADVAFTVEAIVPGTETLPDDYQPVPQDKWIIPKRKIAANVRPGDMKNPTATLAPARSTFRAGAAK